MPRNIVLKKGAVLALFLLFLIGCIYPTIGKPSNFDESRYFSIGDRNNTPRESLVCDHIAYVGGGFQDCWIYKSNKTIWECICDKPGLPSSGATSIDERIYICEGDMGQIWVIDPEDCNRTHIGGGGVELNGLAYDHVNDKMYGTASSELYEIDPETGEQTFIGNYNVGGIIMISIACDKNGTLYGWDVKFSGDSNLYKINKETGQATIVGSLGKTLLYAQDGGFCKEDDILYLAAWIYSPEYGCYLLIVDKETGECDIIGQFEGDPHVTIFTFPYMVGLHPMAEFNWTPTLPHQGETILFNASDSYDPDGYIKLYEWDWDNDGEYDYKNYTSPIATHIFEDAGYYPVTLRVHDNNFTINTTTKTVIVGNQPPTAPYVTGPQIGRAGVEYEWTFVSTDPEEDNITYYIDFGDQCGGAEYYGPFPSGEVLVLAHTYPYQSIFIINALAIDEFDAQSDWTYYEVTMPRNKVMYNSIFLQFLERFPLLIRIINILGWNI